MATCTSVYASMFRAAYLPPLFRGLVAALLVGLALSKVKKRVAPIFLVSWSLQRLDAHFLVDLNVVNQGLCRRLSDIMALLI